MTSYRHTVDTPNLKTYNNSLQKLIFNERGKRMRKVLIVDDELLVRVGLKTLINWSENGFKIVGEAKNGEEAIDLFDKYDPDILLTDIKMPKMEGLELIQKLKKKKKNIKSIILSHYDDFSYAKEAIKLGACDYILKSELSSENLLRILNKVTKDLQNEGVISNNNNQISKSQQEQIGIPVIDNKQMEKSIDTEIKLSSDNDIFSFVSIKLYYDKDVDSLNKININGFSDTIVNISRQIINTNCDFKIYIKNRYELLYLIKFSNAVSDERINNTVVFIKKSLERYLNIKSLVGISVLRDKNQSIKDIIDNSKTAMKKSFFEKNCVQMFNKAMLFSKYSFKNYNFHRIELIINKRNRQELKDFLNTIFDKLLKAKDYQLAKNVFIELLSYAKFISTEYRGVKQETFNISKLKYDSFDELYNIFLVREYILDLYDQLYDFCIGKESKRYSYIINKSIEYIRENYMNNITLNDVAEYVEVSKSYLSLLFRQETSINFSTFLTEYRIQHAKNLLTESNKRIYEVAEMVGFENPYYFSKVFKEITGMTCKDYKTKVSRKVWMEKNDVNSK